LSFPRRRLDWSFFFPPTIKVTSTPLMGISSRVNAPPFTFSTIVSKCLNPPTPLDVQKSLAFLVFLSTSPLSSPPKSALFLFFDLSSDSLYCHLSSDPTQDELQPHFPTENPHVDTPLEFPNLLLNNTMVFPSPFFAPADLEINSLTSCPFPQVMKVVGISPPLMLS